MEAVVWLGRIAGGVLLVGGGWLLARGRRGISRSGGAEPGAIGFVGIGLAIAGLGYHVLAWSLPKGWAAFAVPADRWWLVTLVCVGVALGAWRVDRSP